MDQPWGRACGVLWPVVFVTGVIANHNHWVSGCHDEHFVFCPYDAHTNQYGSVMYDIIGMTHMVNTAKKRGPRALDPRFHGYDDRGDMMIMGIWSVTWQGPAPLGGP
jgi:hypothetical protein